MSKPTSTHYYVDEAGDGVLFGPKGRNRLIEQGASQFFMLGMVQCVGEAEIGSALEKLRDELRSHPLYATIPSMQITAGKTARAFHAKDDHPEVRAKVMELLIGLDFKFYAVIKDMRKVLSYVEGRNRMHADYRYHPNELYDLTVRMLFKQRLHKHDHYHVVFARRGKADRTKALREQLERARDSFINARNITSKPPVEIVPAYPWEQPCLQVADYCLWALQRCYERHEGRFLHALWNKVSLIHDVDDPADKNYGTYLSRRASPPDVAAIKNRWI